MYRKFKWLRGCGFFSDFSWDSSVPDFARINIIYGANGTGKTSLANALDAARTSQDPPGYERLSVVIDGQNRTATDGRDNEIFSRTFVFSEAFVQRSHNFSPGFADMPAVLTVGERTVDAERQLEILRSDLESKTADRDRHEDNMVLARKGLEKTYGSISQQVVDAASKAGGRWRSRANYSVATVRKAFAESSDDWQMLNEVELKKKLSIINSSNAEKIDRVDICVAPKDDLTIRLSNALRATPTTVLLRSLVDHPEASSWVSQGRNLHEGLSECIFCGGDLGVDRLFDIDAHFSAAVKNLESELKAVIEDIGALLKSINTTLAALPARGLFFEDLRSEWDDAENTAQAELKELRGWAANLKTTAQAKLTNVLAVSSSYIEPAPRVRATALLKLCNEHNTRVEEHAAQVLTAAAAVEHHYLKASEATVRNGERTAVDQEQKVADLENGENGIKKIEEQIITLENAEGDPLPSAKVLTEEVSRLLGRNELEFSTVGDRYNVLRDGEPAEGLSLGERTAITLVHFLETVRCFDASAGKPIVIIDDPVSSLDSDIFMGISTYIWNEVIVKDHIVQLFLLTHNFELFRQWDIQMGALHDGGKIDGRKAKDVYPTEFYEIRPLMVTKSGVTRRRPVFETWPPSDAVRKKVRSTYHHAFMAVAGQYLEIKANDTMDTRLTAQLLFPNVIRRMLETFLAFKHPEWVGNFNGAMRNSALLLENAGYAGDPNALRLRLTRYAHAHSHGDTPITEAVVAPGEITSAMLSVFEFMHCLDPDHFDGICRATGVDASELLMPLSNLPGDQE